MRAPRVLFLAGTAAVLAVGPAAGTALAGECCPPVATDGVSVTAPITAPVTAGDLVDVGALAPVVTDLL